MAEPLVVFKVGLVVGWADAGFRIGCNSIDMSVSYLSDPLGDLVRLALLAATGADEAHITFDGEGQAWRIEFATIAAPEPGKPGLMQLTVRDGASAEFDRQGVLFRGDCATYEFAGQVLREALSVRDAYLAIWQRAVCPPAALYALQAALDVLAPGEPPATRRPSRPPPDR